jgi:hypothetical protein
MGRRVTARYVDMEGVGMWRRARPSQFADRLAGHAAVARAWDALPAATTLAVVAVTLFLYLQTMPPTITWWFGGADSGELVAAADVLGIAHPTGYPLFILAGHVATRVPLGDVAVRVNAMNALLSALAAGTIALTVWTLTAGVPGMRHVRALAATLSALAVATSMLAWSQAIIAEVYALHAALTALILLVWAREHGHPVSRGAVHGLALTNHLTSVIFLVAAGAACVRGRGTPRERIVRGGLFALALVAMLSLYALLPLRAARGPVANWGDPDSPGRFLAHVTGRQYRHMVDWRVGVEGVRGTLRSLRTVAADVPPWLLPAAAVGAVHLARCRRRYAVFTGLSAAGILAFVACYRAPDRIVYLLPLYGILGVWGGVGLVVVTAAARRWTADEQRRRRLTALGALALAASVVWWAAGTRAEVNLRGDDSALVFARTTLMSLPTGATYYSARDDVTFALWYAQRSLGVRPDVHVIDVRMSGEPLTP